MERRMRDGVEILLVSAPDPTTVNPMNASLNRVILYVQDVGRLADFYRNVLGLPIVEEIKGEWSVHRAGACEIALHRVGKPWRVADPSSWQVETNVKLVLMVERELAELRAELLVKGVPMSAIK